MLGYNKDKIFLNYNVHASNALMTQLVLIQLTSFIITNSSLGVGMLCFNKRLGCLESNQSNPPTIAICMSKIFDMMQEALLMPVNVYKYFRTPFYKRFEKEAIVFYK